MGRTYLTSIYVKLEAPFRGIGIIGSVIDYLVGINHLKQRLYISAQIEFKGP